VGKIFRSVVGKAVLATMKICVLEAAGPLPLCAGQDAGCKAAKHAMRSVFILMTPLRQSCCRMQVML